MAHCIVPEAEEILDKEFKVLDKGFVRMVDYYGSDQRIVQSARVSYGDGTKSVSQDAELIDYLLRHQHTSPFEQVVFTFHLKMPIFVARQWVRHRMGRMNEVSGRYSVMRDEFYVPEDSCIAKQSKDNKQGRESEPLPETEAEESETRSRPVRSFHTRPTQRCLTRDLRARLPGSTCRFLSTRSSTGRWICTISSIS